MMAPITAPRCACAHSQSCRGTSRACQDRPGGGAGGPRAHVLRLGLPLPSPIAALVLLLLLWLLILVRLAIELSLQLGASLRWHSALAGWAAGSLDQALGGLAAGGARQAGRGLMDWAGGIGGLSQACCGVLQEGWLSGGAA